MSIGKILPNRVDTQIPAIPNLKHDYSVMIDENGTQVQTVDNHWSLGNPLPKDIRDKLDRRGVCLSCHKNIPDGDLAISSMKHISNMLNMEIDKKTHGDILNKSIKISAWVQIVLPLLLIVSIFGGVVWWRRR